MEGGAKSELKWKCTNHLLYCFGYCHSVHIELSELRADGPCRDSPYTASHWECGCSSPNGNFFLKSLHDQPCSIVNDQNTQSRVWDHEIPYPGLSDVWGHNSQLGYVCCPVRNLPGGNHLQVHRPHEGTLKVRASKTVGCWFCRPCTTEGCVTTKGQSPWPWTNQSRPRWCRSWESQGSLYKCKAEVWVGFSIKCHMGSMCVIWSRSSHSAVWKDPVTILTISFCTCWSILIKPLTPEVRYQS